VAHVDVTSQPKGFVPAMAAGYAKRRFGQQVEPVRAASHHTGVLVAMGAMETAVDKGWRRIDPQLRWLAVQTTAGVIGCPWCTDFGAAEGVRIGVPADKISGLRHWHSSDAFDERERAVIEFAEAASATPARVSDALIAVLHGYFDDGELVELAAWVALENQRSRFNAALGLKSEGFTDRCDVPAARDLASAVSDPSA
jgi:alkylhydroperoxidase family enzyme